jgi:lipoprotein-anchoring transpeptidase ErfK/SrfK
MATGSPEHADAAARLVPGPALDGSWIARVVQPTVAKSRPWGRARQRLGVTAPWGGGQVQLMVLDSVEVVRDARRPRDERVWIKVRLPRRPNDATGWVPADHVQLRRIRHRIEIGVAQRRARLLRDGKVVRSFPVVVGKPATPTPQGLLAVNEIIRQPASGILGPWALHLTAHSNVLYDFGGGPGRTAIHGRSGELLADPLGTARSNGCIRIPNEEIARLARTVVPGTPVRILPRLPSRPDRRAR